VTNAELLKQWQDGEQRQRELWKKILSRGLYLNVLGIDPTKRDTAWRTPPGMTRESERKFYAGVVGKPRSVYYQTRRISVTEKELAEFD
jgi:hypothetical protein